MGSAQSTVTVITTKTGKTRQFRSKQERRQIVEDTLKPGASVALVARAHGVNANQVFKWRRQYQQGRLEVSSTATLLPVKVTDAGAPQTELSLKHNKRKSGIIDIDLGHARIRIEGTADADCVRAAIEGLVR
jgi:transposase